MFSPVSFDLYSFTLRFIVWSETRFPELIPTVQIRGFTMIIEEGICVQPCLLDMCSLPIFDRDCMDGVGLIVA